MKIKKVIKKIKKSCKKMKRGFLSKENENGRTAAPQAQAVQTLPFVSFFASMRIQKEQKSVFWMAGNDVSKINSDAYTPMRPQPENVAIDASVKIELKNQDLFE